MKHSIDTAQSIWPTLIKNKNLITNRALNANNVFQIHRHTSMLVYIQIYVYRNGIQKVEEKRNTNHKNKQIHLLCLYNYLRLKAIEIEGKKMLFVIMCRNAQWGELQTKFGS